MDQQPITTLVPRIRCDKHGETWKSVTCYGWERIKDMFFWPADPTSDSTHMGMFPHTVEQVAEIRFNITNNKPNKFNP